MSDRTAASARSRRKAFVFWILAGVLIMTLVFWSFSGPDALGSNVLIVIEDVSPNPTGSFPGTVCYQLVRDRDEAVMTEGCLAVAASISAPAGFDRSVLYTLHVNVNSANCTVLDDVRSGSGFTPFLIRVSCDPGLVAQTGAADAAAPVRDITATDSMSASPVAIPVATDP